MSAGDNPRTVRVARPLLYLTSGHREGPGPERFATAGAAEVAFHDTYALDRLDLDGYAALLVSMHVDQRHLAERAPRLDAYLRAGGTIVANGHHAYPFLPGLSTVRRLLRAGLKGLTIHRERDHPIWAGVAVEELTLRKGVAGFYGRGWHAPPADAIVVHTIGPDRGPVDVIYRVERGRVLFHGGNDLWQYGGAGDTTGRILPQLLAWIAAGASVL